MKGVSVGLKLGLLSPRNCRNLFASIFSASALCLLISAFPPVLITPQGDGNWVERMKAEG